MFYNDFDKVKDNIEKKIEWYDKKSKLNKIWYIFLAAFDIIISAFIPFTTLFLDSYSTTQYIVAFMGSIVTILSGLLATFQFHKLWINYRFTTETLKTHRDLFEMDVYPYNGTDKAQLLIKNISLIESELNVIWISNEKNKNLSKSEI